MSETTKDVSKLPKWAQDHILSLTLERNSYKAEVARMAEEANKTHSPFYIDAWYSPTRTKRFIQAPTNQITVEHAGVRLDVFIPYEGDNQRPKGIELKYAKSGDVISRGVALVPCGYGTLALVASENL